MRARIERTSMGFHVELSAARDRFTQLLETFKSTVPRKCRRFMGRYWFVDLRAKKRLDSFASSVTSAGGKVDR